MIADYILLEMFETEEELEQDAQGGAGGLAHMMWRKPISIETQATACTDIECEAVPIIEIDTDTEVV
jgi:hypothetical protein